MVKRRPFSLASAILCGLALVASLLLAGCGGGGSNGGKSSSPYAGSYVGSLVSLNSGADIYAFNTVALSKMTVTADGTVSGSFSGIIGGRRAPGSTLPTVTMIPFTGTLSTHGVLTLAYTSDILGGFPAHAAGTLTAGKNHTLTATLQETRDRDGFLGPAYYVTFGTPATTPAITGTHAITLTIGSNPTLNGSITIAADGSLTETLNGTQGNSVSGSGYLDANNNLFFTDSRITTSGTSGNPVPTIFVGSLQPTAGGFAATGMDYNSGSPLNVAFPATATISTTANSPFTGTYLGVYLTTSGPSAPDAGTVMLTVNPNGTVAGTTYDFLRTNPVSGTLNSNGTLTTSLFSGLFSENPTTHVFSVSYTGTDGSKGMLSAGPAPSSSALAGTYSGTFSNSSGGSGTATLGIASNGEAGVSFSPETLFAIGGYVDQNNNFYEAYDKFESGERGVITGHLTFNGTSVSSTLQETNADGSTLTDTLSLTKQ